MANPGSFLSTSTKPASTIKKTPLTPSPNPSQGSATGMSTGMGMQRQPTQNQSWTNSFGGPSTQAVAATSSRPRDYIGEYIGPPGSDSGGSGGGGSTYQPPSSPQTPAPGALPKWNPPSFTPQQSQTTPAAVNPRETDFFGGAPGIFQMPNYEGDNQSMEQYIASTMPVAQFAQNNEQYRNDFNEQQRRWNAEHGVAQQQTGYQQGLSTRQQQSAEWQASQAANQWDRQFGHTSAMDVAGLDLAGRQLDIQGQQANNEGRQVDNQGREIDNTGNYQQGLVANQSQLNNAQARYWQGQNVNQAAINASQGQYWQGQNANQQFANEATAQYQQGLIGNQGFSNQTDRQNVNNQFALGSQANATNAQSVTNQNQLGQKANQIDEMYKAGLISNEDRSVRLAELTQQQNNIFLYSQMNNQSSQAALDRAMQERLGSMAAFGRSSSPATNWARSWS